MKNKIIVPSEIKNITETLQEAGFEAYLVGGCVRDILIGREPKDWDVTTNAKPEEIQKLFPNTYYTNKFGTVGVVNEKFSCETLKVIEVTPYRIESEYSDFRHPDEVIFTTNLQDDLKRRDFTMNAIAYDPSKGHLVDPYKGQEDIKDMIVRAVGIPSDRFREDALRILRAVRFSIELGFAISSETIEAMEKESELVKKISAERICDEFTKIIMSDNPMGGVIICQQLSILNFILPELEKGMGLTQNSDHIYDIWEHSLRALNHSAERKWPLPVRLAALLHDVGKVPTRDWNKEKNDWTFYGHDVVGERITRKILERLKYPNKIIDKVTKLVRNHMFFTDIDKITLSAVRRIVRNVGPENVWDLMNVRACDRIGMGRPKEAPYRLRKYESMIEEAMRAPVSVGMLKIDGAKIMEVTKLTAGPKIGFILHALLEEALDNPDLNTEEYLQKRAIEMSKLPEKELAELGEKGKEKKTELETKEITKIRSKYGVK